MSNEMIERVAKAIKKAEHSSSDLEFFLPYAKAAIQAMREPTEEMIMAYHNDFELESYQAMIDAALKED